MSTDGYETRKEREVDCTPKARKVWKKEEDLVLKYAVALQGGNEESMDWDQVALALNQADIGAPYNAFQCKQRWNSHLNPSINKGEWTKEEDRTIIELQKNWGNKWAKIARELSGRTNYAVMNRWSKLTKNGSYAYAKKSNDVDVTTTEARMPVSFPPPVEINLKDIDFDDDDVYGQIASLFLRASLNE